MCLCVLGTNTSRYVRVRCVRLLCPPSLISVAVTVAMATHRYSGLSVLLFEVKNKEGESFLPSQVTVSRLGRVKECVHMPKHTHTLTHTKRPST